MAVKGAILGDIAGSQYEFTRPFHPETCEMFNFQSCFTDDTVMTLALKKAMDENLDYAETMRAVGKHYPYCGYGGSFEIWINNPHALAYGSYGNGAAMRVSYVADFYDDLEDVKKYARASAEVSHNHPEGLKGAEVTAVCIWMAKHGKTKEDIYQYVLEQYPADQYPYSIEMSVEEMRKKCSWDVTCMGSVPVAMRCFYESTDFESFMRNLYRLECDMDTLGAIGGGVVEEYYHGVGFDADEILGRYLDERLKGILYGGMVDTDAE